MKILQIVADGNPGGGTTFVLEMLKSLKNPLFLCQKGSYAIREASALGIETYEIDFFTSRFDLRIPWRIQKILRDTSPDLIHVHGNRAAFFLSFCRNPSPILYTVHGLHGLYNGNALGKWGEKQALRSKDHIVFVSKWEETLAKKNNLLPHANHQVIYNGIHLKNLPKHQPRDGKLLGFLGRLETPKDPLFMLDVMEILGPQGYHLKMIGGGTFEQTLKKSPYITVTGTLPREKALEELSKVSCVIAPSRWEAFGLVLVESLALGIPIIAANIPAFHEILESGKHGILISEKNPQKYAAAVLQGVSPPSPSLEKFSWEQCFTKYMAIFSDLKRSND